MILFIQQDIAEVEADVIVNAANGIGYMGGWLGRWFRDHGVAESLHYASNGSIERRAKKQARKHRPKPGEVYITEAHPLKVKWIFHAVTMRFPGTWTKFHVVEKCLQTIIQEAKNHKIKSIAIPGLGTGTGGLSLDDIIPLYKQYLEPETELTIYLVDPSGKLQTAFEKHT